MAVCRRIEIVSGKTRRLARQKGGGLEKRTDDALHTRREKMEQNRKQERRSEAGKRPRTWFEPLPVLLGRCVVGREIG